MLSTPQISNKTFSGLSELVTLHLEDNLLTNLTGGEFADLMDLQELHLHHNRLEVVGSQTFAPLVSLRVLTLHHNRIRSFPVWDVMSVGSQTLKTITLGANPWSCDCLFIQKLETAVAKFRGRIGVPDFKELQCSLSDSDSDSDVMTDISKFNTSCADVMAVSFRTGGGGAIPPSSDGGGGSGHFLDELVPIVAVVAAAIVIVVSLIILAVALRKPLQGW